MIESFFTNRLLLFCSLPLFLNNLRHFFPKEQVVLFFLLEYMGKILKQRSDHATISTLELPSYINTFFFTLAHLCCRFSGQKTLSAVIVRIEYKYYRECLDIFTFNDVRRLSVV